MSWLLFLFFLSISCELIHLKILFFTVRPNILISLLPLSLFFFLHRFQFDKEFLFVALGCFCSLLLSALFGEHLLACYGLLFLFLFKFLTFFVFPMNLFRIYPANLLYRLYFMSFVVIGLFAFAQVLFSAFGIYLPGTTQRIGSLARGQALFHEPSFYALYATPFAIFETARFLLKQKNRLSFFAANIFLLASTSTGCFFSYLALFFFLILFKCLRILRNFSLLKTASLFVGSLSFFGFLFWILQPTLITHGLLKYFGSELLSSSFAPRWEGIKQFWKIFIENPFLGTGLGGATTYYARMEGIEFSSLNSELLDAYGATNVATEILGSLGLLGSFLFFIFFIILWRRCRQTLQLSLSDEERANLTAAILSLCVLFFTLQFNQSIMRPYVWLHVGLCIGYMNSLSFRSPKSVFSQLQTCKSTF